MAVSARALRDIMTVQRRIAFEGVPMRRTRIAAVVLATRVLLALALLPLMAYAAGDESRGYEGVYVGTGQGTGTDGGGGSASVTVWVEDMGDSARITIQVLEYGIVVAAEGPVTDDGVAITVPITVDSMGVSGTGTITLTPSGEFWVMSGEGAGTALGYDGTGTLVADQVSTGFGLPPVGEQITDMFEGIIGGPTKAKEQASKPPVTLTSGTTGAGATSGGSSSGSGAAGPKGEQPKPAAEAPSAEAPAAEVPAAGQPAGSQAASSSTAAQVVAEPSPLAPAAPEPPFTDFNRIGAAVLAAAILLLQIILA